MTAPLLHPDRAQIADLHPTQITVGLHEVAQKRLRWRSGIRKSGAQPAPRLIAPVVYGPGGALYLVDRHHLLRALAAEGIQRVLIRTIGDFTALPADKFWPALDVRGWCRSFDAEGCRRPFSEMLAPIDGLVDDPFRSLVSVLRRAGGFSKKSTPFSEFAWADFLRRSISCNAVNKDFEGALRRGLALAGSLAARDLPGWRPKPALSVCAVAVLGPPNAGC